MMRPLFIPLRREWFNAFRDGTKRIEWRVYGGRWNVDSAFTGRAVTLSLGYSGARLLGQVVKVERVEADNAHAAARAIFPHATHFCAIHIALDGD